MAQRVKAFAQLKSWQSIKKPEPPKHAYDCSLAGRRVETKDLRSLLAHSLAKMLSFHFSETPCLKF